MSVRYALACQRCSIAPAVAYDARCNRVLCKVDAERLCTTPHPDGVHHHVEIPDHVRADGSRPVLSHLVETRCVGCSTAVVFTALEWADRGRCVDCGRTAAGVTYEWFVPIPDTWTVNHPEAPPPARYPATRATAKPRDGVHLTLDGEVVSGEGPPATHAGCPVCLDTWPVSGDAEAQRTTAQHAHDKHGGPAPVRPDQWRSTVPGGLASNRLPKGYPLHEVRQRQLRTFGTPIPKSERGPQ